MASNALTCLSPEWWVAETLRVFRENMVILPRFSVDYKNVIARAGKIVSVNKRGELYAQRKLSGTNVAASALTAAETLVRLNQQPYVHYAVEDVEQATSNGDVVNEFIEPGAFGVVRFMEQCAALQCYDFFRNQAGGDLVNSVSYNDLIDLRRELSRLKVPLSERAIIINDLAESALLKEDKLTRYDALGNGSALMTGVIGSGAGMQIASSFHMPMPGDDSTKAKQTGAINNSAGYGKGATVLTVNGFDAGTIKVVTVGAFCTISETSAGGAISVHKIIAKTDSGSPLETTSITIEPGLVRPAADNAVVTVYHPGEASLATTYAAQYAGEIRVDMTDAQGSSVPEVGMGISFATSADGPVYGIMSVEAIGSYVYDLVLNRPLDVAVAQHDPACLFPPVALNWSFTRDAVTLVERPLRLPKGAAAAAFGVQNGIGVRVVMGYDMSAQEELVTIDTLFGVKSLDLDKGALLIG